MNNPNDIDPWGDDLLDRKSIAHFLHKLTIQQYESNAKLPQAGALCVALDADWGAGKTFMVKRWIDDLAKNHFAIYFDAWSNDISEDPLISLIAELEKSIKPILKRTTIADDAKRNIREIVSRLRKQAPKAIIPALGIVGKAFIKKATTIELDEISDLFSENEADTDSSDKDNQGHSDKSELSKAAEKGLERFIEDSIKLHNSRIESIKKLKIELSEVIKQISAASDIHLPAYIFIDELDRCRPDYAIRLLEGVKHLFDAEGICFVFATNLKQLSATTQAVYGPNFDGHMYLKRFFSFEYRLPYPKSEPFARLLASRSSLPSKRVIGCLPNSPATLTSLDDKLNAVVNEFALICQLFQLNLRSQSQVMSYANAAASGLDKNEPIYCLLLFFYCALQHLKPEDFYRIKGGSANMVSSVLSTLSVNAPRLRYDKIDQFGRRISQDEISISSILQVYLEASGISMRQIFNELSHDHIDDPGSRAGIIKRIATAEERNGGHNLNQTPTIGKIYELVRLAGNLSE